MHTYSAILTYDWAPWYSRNNINENKPPLISFHYSPSHTPQSEGIEMKSQLKFADGRTNHLKCIQCAADVQNGT